MPDIGARGGAGGTVHGEATGTLNAPVVFLIVLAIIAFFFIMEAGNIGTQFGNFVQSYRGVTTPPTSTVPPPTAQQVNTAAGQIMNGAASAATSTNTPTTAAQSSVG